MAVSIKTNDRPLGIMEIGEFILYYFMGDNKKTVILNTQLHSSITALE